MGDERLKAKFIDRTGASAPELKLIDPVLITKEELEAEMERLASLPAPANGQRMSVIAHPHTGVGDGLAPGTQVTISVLKPGERTKPIRHNSSQVNFCIRGGGHSVINGKRVVFRQYDVWNTPSMNIYEHVNDTNELQVRLAYSNAALLEKMNIHVVDDDPYGPKTASEHRPAGGEGHGGKMENPFGTFQITDEGAWLMPYEKLVNPDVVEWPVLHWPWEKVKANLDRLAGLGQEYRGRRLYLLYHPASGRLNGTSPTFFATITLRPPKIVDRPHRHSSSAINYFFSGSGHSLVDGKRYHWKAGDLMLTAPGWAIHNHASNDEPVYELTIQDSPLNISMDSLMWQEDLGRPFSMLGSQKGFETNRAKLAG